MYQSKPNHNIFWSVNLLVILFLLLLHQSGLYICLWLLLLIMHLSTALLMHSWMRVWQLGGVSVNKNISDCLRKKVVSIVIP